MQSDNDNDNNDNDDDRNDNDDDDDSDDDDDDNNSDDDDTIFSPLYSGSCKFALLMIMMMTRYPFYIYLSIGQAALSRYFDETVTPYRSSKH